MRGAPVGETFLDLPRRWNQAAEGIGDGFATFALSVRLPPGAPPLALWLPDVNSAYRLWINGQPAGGLGTVAPDAAGEVPRTLPSVVVMSDGTGIAYIVLQVFNHQHREGGPAHALVLGKRDDLLGGRPALSDAMKLADDALYAAKAAGRNRIAVADGAAVEA